MSIFIRIMLNVIHILLVGLVEPMYSFTPGITLHDFNGICILPCSITQ